VWTSQQVRLTPPSLALYTQISILLFTRWGRFFFLWTSLLLLRHLQRHPLWHQNLRQRRLKQIKKSLCLQIPQNHLRLIPPTVPLALWKSVMECGCLLSLDQFSLWYCHHKPKLVSLNLPTFKLVYIRCSRMNCVAWLRERSEYCESRAKFEHCSGELIRVTVVFLYKLIQVLCFDLWYLQYSLQALLCLLKRN